MAGIPNALGNGGLNPSTSPYADWTFAVGGVTLTKFEVPQSFNIGHELHLAVHHYISSTGQPTIKTQSLGSFYIPTKWKGTFLYSTALNRALAIDAMFLSGNPVTWQYGPFSWQVVISKFEMTVHHQLEVDYDIEMQVVNDLNGQSLPPDDSLAFDAGVQNLYSAASAANNALYTMQQNQLVPVSEWASMGIIPTSVPSVTIPPEIFTQSNTLTSLLQTAYPLNSQTFGTILSIVAQATAVLNSIEVLTTSLENNAVLEADLAALNECLIMLQGYGLLITNLNQLLGVSSTAQTIQVFTGSLFDLAAEFYPSAPIDQAVSLLAQANNLNDFQVYTPQTITIPPLFQ